MDAGDAIVEISSNGQQWTTDRKHFAFCADAASPPPTPAAPSRAARHSNCSAPRSSTPVGKARFVRLPAVEGDEEPTMPDDPALYEGIVEVTPDAISAEEGSVELRSRLEGAADTGEPFACAAVAMQMMGRRMDPRMSYSSTTRRAARAARRSSRDGARSAGAAG